MEKTLEQRASNCLRIVLFGPESTGKTTLAQQLAVHFNTLWVPEFMRGYLQQKWDNFQKSIEPEDILPIAYGQMALENKALEEANGVLFCDTNLRELKVYCNYYDAKGCPPEIITATEKNHYDFYFLTDIDVPWEADDLRDRPYDRSTLFCMFETELKEHNLPFAKLTGRPEVRFNQAINILKSLKLT